MEPSWQFGGLKVYAGLDVAVIEARRSLEEAIGFLGKDLLLLLSCGSALEIVEGFNYEVLKPGMRASVLDERYSFDEKVINYVQLQNTSFTYRAEQHGCELIATRPYDGESLDDLSARIGNQLRAWRKTFEEGKVVVTMGVSDIGHTAGISPFADDGGRFMELFDEDKHRWVVGYEGRLDPPARVTVSPGFLKDQVDVAVVYMRGEEKRDALNKLLAEDGDWHVTPARVMREMKDVRLYTDLKI